MKLKDILSSSPIEKIQVRTNDPFGDDTLFGFCRWTGTELVSLDGDNYSLDDEVEKYEFDEYGLTYWFKSEWV